MLKAISETHKSRIVTASVAGAIAALIYKIGVPQNLEQLTVFMVLAAFGMLAWMIQQADVRAAADRLAIQERQGEIVHTQDRITIVMENHLSTIEKTLAVFLERNEIEAKRTEQLLPPFIQMMESVKMIENKLLDAVLEQNRALNKERTN